MTVEARAAQTNCGTTTALTAQGDRLLRLFRDLVAVGGSVIFTRPIGKNE